MTTIKSIFATCILMLATTLLQAQVGIGTVTPSSKLEVVGAGTTSATTALKIGNASSTILTVRNDGLVEVASTTQGFLPPRMTTAQRNNISSPAEGLLIYNTTNKSIEAYIGSSGSSESCLSGNEFCQFDVGSYYTSNSWQGGGNRGMAQSFISGGGLLGSITIKVGSIVSQSTSSLYELNIFNGSPSCGTVGTNTCALSDLGTPIATCQVSINSSGEKTLHLTTPVSLSSNQTYTFSITPTVSTQGFSWQCYSTGYSNGASFGISGPVSSASDDFKFQTNYVSGWRSLKLQ
jgi:hypothetical protein